MSLHKIVFIDRDGVINVDPIGDYIKRWEDFRFEEGALAGMKKLSDAGFEIIIISNQAGIGDGVYPASELQRIQENMERIFKEKGIRFLAAHYCHHGKKAGCSCRKPQTGLFEKAVQGLVLDKSKTFFIGDKISDVQAGKNFGLKTAFVLTGHGKYEVSDLDPKNPPDLICQSLREAAEKIIA